jgi:DNA-binding protein H-NS
MICSQPLGEQIMRRPRDYDADLASLDRKVRALRQRKVVQLGELIIACKADSLSADILAGALLDAVAERDTARREAWRARGAALFPDQPRRAGKQARGERSSTGANPGAMAPAGPPSQS